MFASVSAAGPSARPFIPPPPAMSPALSPPAAAARTSATRYVLITPAASTSTSASASCGQSRLYGSAASSPNRPVYCTAGAIDGVVEKSAVLNAISAHCDSHIAVAAVSDGLWHTSDRPVRSGNMMRLTFSSRIGESAIRLSIEVQQPGRHVLARDILLPDDAYVLFRAVATAVSIMNGRHDAIAAGYGDTCRLLQEVTLRMLQDQIDSRAASRAYVAMQAPQTAFVRQSSLCPNKPRSKPSATLFAAPSGSPYSRTRQERGSTLKAAVKPAQRPLLPAPASTGTAPPPAPDKTTSLSVLLRMAEADRTKFNLAVVTNKSTAPIICLSACYRPETGQIWFMKKHSPQEKLYKAASEIFVPSIRNRAPAAETQSRPPTAPDVPCTADLARLWRPFGK